MPVHDLRYLANCSLLFTELPLLERPQAAKAAGFDAIEFWWPFPTATPDASAVGAFVAAVSDAGVQLVGLNFFAGDLAGPDCGMLSVPGRASEFRDSVDIAVAIGQQLAVGAFNALYGVRTEGESPAVQDSLALENLAYAARAVRALGATVLVEPVSGPKPYPIRTVADAASVVEQACASGNDNIGVLFDVFHLASNGDDLIAAIDKYAHLMRHVQVADVPGRGEPGTGTLDIDASLQHLQRAGYTGWVSLEYKPSAGDTLASLSWLPRERRAANS